jgi:hypothetical protein
MDKPPTHPLSDLVRSCPEASQKVPRGEERRREEIRTPLTPRSGGNGQAVDRVRNGSRRKRDRAALAAEQIAGVTASPDADAAWAKVVKTLTPLMRPDLPATLLEPVIVIGERDGYLVVAAEAGNASWLRRRYGAWVGDAVRVNSRFTGIFITDQEPS